MLSIKSISKLVSTIKYRLKTLTPKGRSKIRQSKSKKEDGNYATPQFNYQPPPTKRRSSGYPQSYLARQKYPPKATVAEPRMSYPQVYLERQQYPPPMTKCRQWSQCLSETETKPRNSIIQPNKKDKPKRSSQCKKSVQPKSKSAAINKDRTESSKRAYTYDKPESSAQATSRINLEKRGRPERSTYPANYLARQKYPLKKPGNHSSSS